MSDPDPTVLERDVDSGDATLSISGEVDEVDSSAFCESIIGCAGPGVSAVTLDLSGVTFLGSAGIGAMITAWLALQERSVRLRFGECSDVVERVLSITGVRDQISAQ